MFRDREDAARQLAAKIQNIPLKNPLVAAIPRGGVVTGAVLARQLGAELDVVLARKLHAPREPELALGAIAETGQTYLNREAINYLGVDDEYLRLEKQRQLAEIRRRSQFFRRVRPAVPIAGRSVIVTDDGIATGSTMMAALETLRAQNPLELIVAVPVAPLDRLNDLESACDKMFCLHAPAEFWAVGQFYEEFPTVEDDQVVEILKSFALQPALAGKSGQDTSDLLK